MPVLFDMAGTFESGSVLAGTVTIDTATGVATGVNALISAPASRSFGIVEAQWLALPGVYQLQIGDGGALPDLNIGLSVAGSNLADHAGGPIYAGSSLFYSAERFDRLTGSLTPRVPEPETPGLLGLGLPGASLARRRRTA